MPLLRVRTRIQALLRTSAEIIRTQGWIAFGVRLAKWLRGERRYQPTPEQGGFHTSPGFVPNIQERYEAWMKEHEPDDDELIHHKILAQALEYQPLISVLMPVYNPPLDALRAAIQSVLDQSYQRFELCIADASENAACSQRLDHFAQRDKRVRLLHLEHNRGISENTNVALAAAVGEFVALMDQDDLLAPFALLAVAEALKVDPELDILYSDEDKLSPEGKRIHPFLKPDWSPELLHSFMYVGHLTVYRKTLIEALGGFRSEYDGSQDYDLILRAAEVTSKIHHIPQVLYHWRMSPTSAAAGGKAHARVSNLAALSDAIERHGYRATVQAHDYSNEVRFHATEHPLISIIIPTDSVANISLCLRSILEKSTYRNIELITVSSSRVAEALSAGPLSKSTKWMLYENAFNFSRKCNLGAGEAKGKYLVFLNDDVSPISERWLEGMLSYAQLPEIGGVSPKLLYTDNTIQYAGLVTGVRDLVGTAFHRWPHHNRDYYALAMSYRNVSVLTGACLMIRRAVFEQVGGWDSTNTPVANSDLDLSFRIRDLGLRLVYTPFVELRHIGHKSLGEARSETQDDTSHLYTLDRWGKYISYDPYFPPGMRELTYHDKGKFEIFAQSAAKYEQRDWRSQKNILLISHDLSLSGAPLVLFETARHLQRSGYFVCVMAPHLGGMLDNYQNAQIPVIIDPHVLDHPEIQKHSWAPFHLVLANTVLAWRCVHLSSGLGKPCVWLIHESSFGLAHLISIGPSATGTFELADEVIVPSHSTAVIYQQLRRAGPIRSIPYGIEDPETVVASTPPFQRSQGRLHIVMVGTIEQRKGPDLLLSALLVLPEALQARFEVFLVGRHLFPEYLAELTRTLRDLPNVHVVGEVARPVGLAYIKHADVFVCASREETGPIVLVEAMALGKAVISTRVGAASEIITHGESGYLIDIDDHRALAGILVELLNKPEEIESVGKAARATFERHLKIERYGNELARIFDRLIKLHQPSDPNNDRIRVLDPEA